MKKTEELLLATIEVKKHVELLKKQKRRIAKRG